MMRRSLSAQEERQLLACVASRAAIEARRDAAWMRALRFSGCRVGEFSRVSVGAALMALERRHLFIPREDRKGGKRDHDVLVTEPLRAAIAELLHVRELQTGLPVARMERRGALVLNRYGKRLSVRSYQLRLRYWCAQARLALDVTPHWFRHTKAMAIMRRSQAQDPRGMVRLALGHADINSSSVYTQPTREDFAEAMEMADGARPIRRRQARRTFETTYAGRPAGAHS